MNALTIIVLAVAAIAIYKVASDRGKRKVSKEVIKRDEALDREEIGNERENRDNTDAYDELNDTINRGKSKRKRQGK